jgi:glycosyltransferase involved in cell wall biosynthesis
VHELIPGMDFRDRGERSTEGRPLNVLIFGRTDKAQKGAAAAAEAVSRLRETGLPVRLIVRGVPVELVEEQRLAFSEIVGGSDPVDVRPYTEARSDLHADLDEADVMVMTSRAEGFGLSAQEAAAAGVPVVVPSGSGFGRWLGESGQFSPELTEPGIVPQGFEDRVPVDLWFDKLRTMLEDYPTAQQRALDLQQEFKDRNVTWARAVGLLIDEAKGLE